MKSYRNAYDSLYVGGHESAKRAPKEFDTIISLAEPAESTDYQFVIEDGEHDYEKFRDAVERARRSIRNGDETLVHCRAGVSRSVSVAIATQVCEYGVSYIEALRNARFGRRLPSKELMDSCERYLIEVSSTEEQIGKSTTDEYADSSVIDVVRRKLSRIL